MLPQDLRYTKSHEYVRVEGDEAVVGITNYASQQLGDVVYVELPEVGRAVKKGEAFGVVESVKAVSDLYSPLSGTVTAVNDALNDEPSLINEDCFGKGWLIRLKPENPAEAEESLDAAAYQAITGEAH